MSTWGHHAIIEVPKLKLGLKRAGGWSGGIQEDTGTVSGQ
jgi:hypothetical protein